MSLDLPHCSAVFLTALTGSGRQEQSSAGINTPQDQLRSLSYLDILLTQQEVRTATHTCKLNQKQQRGQ